jgi:hypothetical protein
MIGTSPGRSQERSIHAATAWSATAMTFAPRGPLDSETAPFKTMMLTASVNGVVPIFAPASRTVERSMFLDNGPRSLSRLTISVSRISECGISSIWRVRSARDHALLVLFTSLRSLDL